MDEVLETLELAERQKRPMSRRSKLCAAACANSTDHPTAASIRRGTEGRASGRVAQTPRW